MDTVGYDPRPEEEEHWEHFCESKEKGYTINKCEYCKFCRQP